MTPQPARRFLQITSYPPPRAGWGVRVQFLKRLLESEGHVCTVLNTGPSRRMPSPEYDTVLGGLDFLRKVWRYSRAGHVVHAHANAKAPKGLALALVGMLVNRLAGHAPVLTFHAGEAQRYFPRSRAGRMGPFMHLLFRLPRVVICNNDAVKRLIAEFGVLPERIRPIQAFSRQYLEFERVSLGADVDAFYRRTPLVLFSYLHMQPTYHPDVLLDAFELVAAARPDVGLLFCGTMGHHEPETKAAVERRARTSNAASRMCFVPDLDHDQFLTALTQSAMYVRTPPADGVASSVLESLALGIPVVAADNGSRPQGVLTYPPTNAEALARAIHHVLDSREAIVRDLPRPEIRDTLRDEATLLLDG